MRCLVTAGPTFEPLDRVRRLTNFSTGRLGTELANYLQERGCEVKLFIGAQSTWTGPRKAREISTFTTTEDLWKQLQAESTKEVHALFHSAAVSDYSFGKVFRRLPGGELEAIKAGKFSTRDGALLTELVPTPKILARVREWFPGARLAGWKYEVDGTREQAIETARRQLETCRTDLCVLNGPAFGQGYGLVSVAPPIACFADAACLYQALREWLGRTPPSAAVSP